MPKVVLTRHKYKVARTHKMINITCNYFVYFFQNHKHIWWQFYTTTSTHHVKFHIGTPSFTSTFTYTNHPHYNKIYWNQFNDQLDLSTMSRIRIANTNIANVVLFQALFIFMSICVLQWHINHSSHNMIKTK